ncbi:MAG: hypothetical protein OXH34_01280 [Bacteroidetes bacterium]|nr:hypothetical protein [Bacteroidota bacterium]
MKPTAIRPFRLIGFCAVGVANSLGRARCLMGQEDGDVYVAGSMRSQNGRILYTGRSH